MRFNNNTTTTKTTNRAGGDAYKQDAKLAFVSLLLNSFLKDQYYRTKEDQQQELVDAINNIADKRFLARAALYARNEFGMRSVTHIVGAELARTVKGEEWMRPFLTKLVRRPDDMAEMWGYYMGKYGKPIPNSMRVSFKKAFDKFDNYQLAKYRMEDKDVKLIDLINYVRPVPTEKNKIALAGLVNDTLKASDTWNAELAKAGRSDEDVDFKKKEVWTKLLSEDKMPYFALVRNLRNIVEQAPELVERACELLVNEKRVKQSLLFPFRFATAIKQLEQDGINNRQIYTALSKALDISMSNVPKFEGRTLVVVDHSGSMDSYGASKQLNMFELGALFGVAMTKVNDADFMHFGSYAKYIGINPLDTTATIMKNISGMNNYGSNLEVGHGTNFASIFQEANKAYDRIVIFSDMQGWQGGSVGSSFANYKKRVGANPKIYSIDLAGYGDMQFPEQDVFCLAGFSDKIFSLMELLEKDKKAMLNAIEAVQL